MQICLFKELQLQCLFRELHFCTGDLNPISKKVNLHPSVLPSAQLLFSQRSENFFESLYLDELEEKKLQPLRPIWASAHRGGTCTLSAVANAFIYSKASVSHLVLAGHDE